MRKLCILILMLLFEMGCASTGTLHIKTDPPGEKVLIQGEDKFVPDRGSVELSPGEYTLKGANQTSPAKTVQVALNASEEKSVNVPIGTKMTELEILTSPPGAKVKVRETGAIVSHGQTISLPRGEYHLKPYQRPESPGAVKAFLRDRQETVTVPVGPGVRTYTFHTDPAGGKILVRKLDRTIGHAKKVDLLPGRYSVVAKKKGHRPNTVKVDLGENNRVEVPLGPVYAKVTVNSSPSGAEVFVDDRKKGRTSVTIELEQGSHNLKLEKSGFYGAEKKLVVKDSGKRKLDLVLSKVPTKGPVSIRTKPEGGKVVFQGQPRGKGNADLGNLSFGSYQVTGIKELSPVVRLYGKKEFEIHSPSGRTVELSLEDKELYYQGKWLDYDKGLSQEARNYRSQRVDNPIGVRVDLDNSTRSALGGINSLASKLHSIARVGDRIELKQGSRSWLIWKRGKGMSKGFKAAVQAFQGQENYSNPWKDDNSSVKWVKASSREHLLAGIAFSLYRARTDNPLLFLSKGQFKGDGLKLQRSKSDGEITVLAMNADSLKIVGDKFQEYNKLLFARLPASDKAVKFTWKQPPQSLLCVSGKEGQLRSLADGQKLLINEKKLLTLVSGRKVKELLRYSSGPDYQGWKREEFKATGPMAGQMDLSRGEIGPQNKPGQYRRIWVVQYMKGNDLTQRQLGIVYEVTDEKKEFSSDKFLRRKRSRIKESSESSD